MKNIYAFACGRIAVFAFGLICLFANAQAPAEAWHRSFNGTANLFDEAKYCRLDAQGNIIITGRSASGSATLLDIVTQKYAPDSTLIWSTAWNNAGYNFDDVPNDLAIAPNGNIIILGYSKTYHGQYCIPRNRPSGNMD